MPVYKATDQLYSSLQQLFSRIELTDPQAMTTVQKSKLHVRFQTTQPAGIVVVNARQRPLAITYGVNGRKPDVDIQLQADTLHQILLGELSIPKALGRRALVASGPIWKTTALNGILNQARQLYPQVLQDQGLR